MNAPLRTRERRTVPLNIITGRSPANCRGDTSDDDVADMAASIEAFGGLIQPLLVSAVPGPLLRFWVDDGGRRYAALRHLSDAGRIPADTPIECDVLVADEGTAREISLAANIMRRDLHPVDQCAAFQAMIAAGVSEDKIAADFAITTRQVRQRLRLTTLSPTIRAAWRDGTITAEIAQAMTAAPSHEAQDALVAAVGLKSWVMDNPHEIRRRLRGEVKSADVPEAIYVGLDAYRAAGGRLDENLFEEHPLILDPELLGRLARERMMREGAALLETTGFGFCLLAADVEQSWTWPQIKPDYLPSETERLRALEEEDEAPDDEDQFEAWTKARGAEQAAIEARGIERASTPAMRAKAGIFLSLDDAGALVVERGMMRPADTEAGTAGEARHGSPAARHADPPAKPADPIEAAGSGRGMVRTILETTIYKALAAIIGHRPDLALLLMVARYGGASCPDWASSDGLGLSPFAKPPETGVLARISGKDFDEAVRICADTPLADLTAAFSVIVGQSVRMMPQARLATLEPLMRAFAARGAALRPAFVEAMDYDGYFEAATKAACLAALDAMAAEHIDRQAKKPVLAALAVEDARKKGWLPFPLAQWAAFAATSPEACGDREDPEPAEKPADPPLAQAMAEAIDADIDRGLDRLIAVDAFLEAHTESRPGARVKASELFARYTAAVGQPFGQGEFGALIAERGIEKHRYANGVHYRDIALKDAPPC